MENRMADPATGTTYSAGTQPEGLNAAALLLERLPAGDREAFTALVREHHAAALRALAACIVGEAWADDAVQEIWPPSPTPTRCRAANLLAR